jgi:hypothetical protein
MEMKNVWREKVFLGTASALVVGPMVGRKAKDKSCCERKSRPREKRKTHSGGKKTSQRARELLFM